MDVINTKMIKYKDDRGSMSPLFPADRLLLPRVRAGRITEWILYLMMKFSF
jgi:hypothetical protein